MKWPVALAWALALPLAATGNPQDDGLFQYSTTRALLAGLYDGDLSIAEASHHGDFAIGTVNAIDGELIAFDGHFFRVGSDGHAHRLGPDTRTPFIVMKHFQQDLESLLPDPLDQSGLVQNLDTLLSSANHFHAIRIRGHFRSVVTRSEPRQTPPYRPLAEIMAEEQVTFELGEVEGTLVGFHSPSFVEGLNVPGYHFHFLTSDEERGGHVLALVSVRGRISIDTAHRLELQLPEGRPFADANLHDDRGKELDAVERGHKEAGSFGESAH